MDEAKLFISCKTANKDLIDAKKKYDAAEKRAFESSKNKYNVKPAKILSRALSTTSKKKSETMNQYSFRLINLMNESGFACIPTIKYKHIIKKIYESA